MCSIASIPLSNEEAQEVEEFVTEYGGVFVMKNSDY
jgi:hypothetical protein